jgi:hypothetical protein
MRSSSIPGSPATARPLYEGGLDATRRLELVASTALGNGAVALHYRRIR